MFSQSIRARKRRRGRGAERFSQKLPLSCKKGGRSAFLKGKGRFRLGVLGPRSTIRSSPTESEGTENFNFFS